MRSVILAAFVLIASLAICCALGGMIGGGLARADGEENGGVGVREATTTANAVEAKLPCPSDMQLVDGMFCPQVQQICLYDVDSKGNKMGPHKIGGRCGMFQAPSVCLSKTRIHKRYCVDTFEIPNVVGELPQSWMSWYDVKAFCESKNKRMMTASEFVFACEGEQMLPYPYKTGYVRDRTSCDTDRDEPNFDRFKDNKTLRYMDRLLFSIGSNPDCVSPFGIRDLVGSIDEFVINETGHPYKSAMVGGHALGVRNRCRTSADEPGSEGTTAHNEWFSFWESGGRCGKDASF